MDQVDGTLAIFPITKMLIPFLLVRFPEQCLTRVEALRGTHITEATLQLVNGKQGFTIDPAYASFSESDLGSLEKGKIADYVVLSQNIMSAPVDKILETKVIATVIDGELAFGRL